MSKFKIFCAVVIAASLTIPAYAAVQNVKVGGDILIQGVGRNNFELDGLNEKYRAVLSAVRVKIDADLTDNVAATMRLVNEREWGTEAISTDDRMDLDLAYVTLKEFLYSPLTLMVGRQELRYGNAFIIGDPDTNGISDGQINTMQFGDLSVKKGFDAIRAVLDYDPLTIDLVYAKIEENSANIEDDINLVGMNANYVVDKDTTAELYWWHRKRQDGSTAFGTDPGESEKLNTVGARVAYTGIENLMLGLESAYQFGDHVTDAQVYPNDNAARPPKCEVDAWALQFISTYAFPEVRYTPTASFTYTYLSGEADNSISDNYSGWDAMYEDQAGGTIFNKILGYSNCHLVNLGGTMVPMEDVRVALNYYSINLAKKYEMERARNLSGVVTDATTLVEGGKSHLADEVDLMVTYDYTEDVQLGLNAGVFIPGGAIENENNRLATQLIGSMKVVF